MDAVLPIVGSGILLYASWSYLSNCGTNAKVRPILFILTALAGALAVYFLSVRAGVCQDLVKDPMIANLMLAAAMVAGGIYVRGEVEPCTDWFHANLVWIGGAGILIASFLPQILGS